MPSCVFAAAWPGSALKRTLERRTRIVAASVVQIHEREIHVRAGIRRLLERELLELELGLEPILGAHRRERTLIRRSGGFGHGLGRQPCRSPRASLRRSRRGRIARAARGAALRPPARSRRSGASARRATAGALDSRAARHLGLARRRRAASRERQQQRRRL